MLLWQCARSTSLRRERQVDRVEVEIFMHSLLHLLLSSYCNAEMIYTDLLPRFDPFSQTPVVAGKHQMLDFGMGA